jgi:hypothetical protein
VLYTRIILSGFIWNRIQKRKISFPEYERMLNGKTYNGSIKFLQLPIAKLKQVDHTLYVQFVVAKTFEALKLIVGFAFFVAGTIAFN